MSTLPPFTPLPLVRARLAQVFDESFPDRSILVGEMAARLVFVAIYGGFVEDSGRYFRPSTVIRFSHHQANQETEAARLSWLSMCQTPGYKATEPWYADNTREPLRDDLIRNRALPIRMILKRQGIATTSPVPIYYLPQTFLSLFDPSLDGDQLNEAIKQWQQDNLDKMILSRMQLRRLTGDTEGQVVVTLPTRSMTLRLSPGEASIITRDVCQELLKKILKEPVVVHVSTPDQKIFPELSSLAEAIGLHLPPSAELPDIVAADTGCEDKKLRLVFIEVVHSDGPITELRKKSLLKIALDMGCPEENVQLITAFDDRNASPFKKRVSEIARGSDVWFRSEPDLLMSLKLLS